jgi:hypothetical protein
MSRVRLVLMHSVTNNEYLDYRVEFIQHFLNRFGDFQYIMVTAIRKK